MRLSLHDDQLTIQDMGCCGARRRWRTLALALWLLVPSSLAAGVVVNTLRWDAERSAELATAKALVTHANREATCWRSLAERVVPLRTYLERTLAVSSCVVRLAQGERS